MTVVFGDLWNYTKLFSDANGNVSEGSYLNFNFHVWFQRGKYYPQLSYLIKVNTPKAVMSETKKAFKKLPNLESAITALTNLKGVGTTMASALLAAACPEEAPFMADECLMAIPDFEGIDYTTKEYLNFVQHIKTVVERLNKESKFMSWDLTYATAITFKIKKF